MPPDDWLTIKAAAERLHKPVRTVRDAAGRLPAEFRRKVEPLPLQVQFPALEAYLRGELPAEDSRPIPPQDAQETRTEAERESAGNTALLAQMQAEIEFLRRQVEAHNVSEGELRRLMMADKAELSRLREQLVLTAGESGRKRRWWQIWRWWETDEQG